jgi:kynurenine formamidase
MIFPYKVVDLTHELTSDIPSWTGGCGFRSEIKLDYKDSEEVSFRVQQIKMHCGVGTHIDAPSHCIKGGISVSEIPLDFLIRPFVNIDVSQNVLDENYQVSVKDIEKFEQENGSIEKGSFVAIRTGWDKFWNDNPKKYVNNHLFPHIAKETAEFLLKKDICGLGVDTISPDIPKNGFFVHELFLGNNKYIVENIANLSKMPAKNCFVMIMPIKGKDITEAPVRMIGLVAKDKMITEF